MASRLKNGNLEQIVRETANQQQEMQHNLSAVKIGALDILAGAEPANAAHTTIVEAIYM